MSSLTACNTSKNIVLIETSMGNIKVKLYDETPLHRDNFLKLAKEGYYDDLLFHRVIKDFMIQGGDPTSRGAAANKMLGAGDPSYTLPAEILYPQLFHKRGVLSAARQGDQVNPEKRSSGSQFYIVWGNTYKDGQLDSIDSQMAQQQEGKIFDRLVNERKAEITQMRKNKDQKGLYDLQEKLIILTKEEMTKTTPPKLTPAQREAYKTIGGTPHLDGDYTVFGEVIEGLDIVGKIQAVATGSNDRPKVDIKMKMKLVHK